MCTWKSLRPNGEICCCTIGLRNMSMLGRLVDETLTCRFFHFVTFEFLRAGAAEVAVQREGSRRHATAVRRAPGKLQLRHVREAERPRRQPDEHGCASKFKPPAPRLLAGWPRRDTQIGRVSSASVTAQSQLRDATRKIILLVVAG